MRTLALSSVLAAAAGAAAMTALSCDPVHDDAVAALGDEAPGVPKGPDHRPGQPCMLCHNGAIGNPSEFSVAGTIFLSDQGAKLNPNYTPTGRGGRGGSISSGSVDYVVDVNLEDANHAKYTTQTNGSGNFYLTPRDYVPTYPMKVTISSSAIDVSASISDDPHTLPMTSYVGRNGSCAGCHSLPGMPGTASPGPSSPGTIYIITDGGAPP
jgi:hypothetical protein